MKKQKQSIIQCSVGITAHNEENNIGFLLQALLEQELKICNIKEIIVVASGCTDRTEEIVEEFSRRDARITLLVQEQREGKASAINLFLSKASSDIIILCSADILPEKETIEKLAAPLQQPDVGMTGGRAIPINPRDTFMGFTVHLLWELHHLISLEHPKLGEMIVFREIIDQISEDTAVDEAFIEAAILEKGLHLCYVPEAIVKNKGAETVIDFIKQRRRIAAGHLHLKRTTSHQVSTRSPFRIITLMVKTIPHDPKSILWSLGAIALEFWARILGYVDIICNRNPVIWPIVKSTKRIKK